jgi:hypothetical protein
LADVLLASPLYDATTVRVPAVANEAVNVALPADIEADPKVVLPSRKETVPVGLIPAMVAVRVMFWY